MLFRSGEILGVPQSTLKYWMQNKDAIIRQAESSSDVLPKILGNRMFQQALKISLEFERRGIDTVSVRDLINLMKINIQYGRLLQGKSTSSVDHRVEPLYRPEKG